MTTASTAAAAVGVMTTSTSRAVPTWVTVAYVNEVLQNMSDKKKTNTHTRESTLLLLQANCKSMKSIQTRKANNDVN